MVVLQFVTQAVAKCLISAGRKGSVVNIGSVDGRISHPVGVAVYGATKSGIENLTKTMALELGAHQIRVNCVIPGAVETPMIPMNDAAIKDFIESKIFPRMVVKRLIQPVEIADTVMFLLSPLSKMIVGEAVVVDGGLLIN